MALPISLQRHTLGTYLIVARQTIRLLPPGQAQVTQETTVARQTTRPITVLIRERNHSLAQILMQCMDIQKQIIGHMLRNLHLQVVEGLERLLTLRVMVPREPRTTHVLKRHMDTLVLPASLDQIMLLLIVQTRLHPRRLHPPPHPHLRRCLLGLVLPSRRCR